MRLNGVSIHAHIWSATFDDGTLSTALGFVFTMRSLILPIDSKIILDCDLF